MVIFLRQRYAGVLNKQLSFVLMVLLVVFFSLELGAQNPSYRKYNADNGFPGNTVYNIFQNGDGYLYGGTDFGITRFNGITATSFDAKGARSKAATGFTIAPNNVVYGINFSGELLRWDSTLTVIPTPHTFASQVACDSLGRVWVAGDNGLYVLYPGATKVVEVPAISEALKKDIGLFTGTPIITRDTIVWFAGVNYVYRWDGKTVQRYGGDFYQRSPVSAVSYMLFESRGEWYMMHKFSQLIMRLNREKFENIEIPGLSMLPEGTKLTNLVMLNDYWWICTYNGVVRYHPQTGEATHWFKDKVITDVHYDQEGNYWFSTLYEGLLRCSNTAIKHWKLSDDAHFTMCTSNGITCLASKQNGDVLLFDSTGASTPIVREQNSDIQFMGWNSFERQYEIASNGFLYRIVGNKTELIHGKFSSLRYILFRESEAIYCSRSGTYRVASSDHPDVIDKLSDTPSRVAAFESDGKTLAVATNSGLTLYARNGNGYRRVKTYFTDSVIYTLCQGFSPGEWLFSTAGGIVYRINQSETPQVFYRSASGQFPKQLVNSGNRIWMTTSSGLLFFNPNENQPQRLDRNDGLISNNVEYLFTDKSNVYISTSAGINWFPVTVHPKRKLPRLLLREINVSGEVMRLPSGDIIELPFNGNLSLSADVVGFSSEEGYNVGYRFTSNGDEWTFVTLIDGVLNFSGFPPGEWALQVIVRDAAGNVTPIHTVGTFRVIPPFWQRWWFYVIMIIVVIIFVTSVFAIYIKRLRAKQLSDLKQLRLVNEARLSQQTALTAQMNPHFIFNVLNSIKGFIYENDKKQASLYLDRFSDLVRRVLHMSGIPMVKLEQELELVKLYFELEALQFDSEPTLEIIADDPEILDLRIPSLLIQPYVENALKHGLRHKTGSKLLTIGLHFDEQEQVLTVKISDNGVGRNAAAAINEDRNKKHSSFATGATERRIRLLNSQRKGIVGVVYVDLLDDNGNPAGTTVELRIDAKNYD